MTDRTDWTYLDFADLIRRDIESGKYAIGEPIPSAREMRKDWGVAVATASRVHAHLRSLGLVEPKKGVGTIVRARSVETGGQANLSSAVQSGLIYGGHRKARIVAAALIEAPGYVASALGLDDGESVIRRERVTTTDDGVVVSGSVSWLPGRYLERAPLLATRERIRQGTFTYLADTLGVRASSGRELLSASTATEEQAYALGLPAGSPVLLKRTWYTADTGEVLEYGEGYTRPDHWVTHEFTV